MAELTEAVADVAEEVAANAQQVADVSRGLTGRDMRMLVGGFVAGAAAAAFATYRVTSSKLETKYNKIAEEEIDAMREVFRARLVSKEEKPDLSGVAQKTEELGYSTPVSPKPEVDPTAVEPEKANIFKDRLATKDPNEGWDYEAERARRTPQIPYVIHTDEREEAGFTEVTFTYYDSDDVVCDEQDAVLSPRNEVIGDHNLNRFGHGSGDPNVVYIRNDALAMEIELIRSPNSYAEEVHGIKHSDFEPSRRRRTRSSPDDE